MQRLAEPLVRSRFGGWALVESPPRRLADGGQHWSLLIVTVAALVAIVAVVLDIRIPSEPQSAVVVPFSMSVERAEAAALLQRAAAPPVSATTERALTEPLTTAPTETGSAAGRAREPVSTAAPQAAESAQAARSGIEPVPSSVVATEQAPQAAEPAGAAAALDDPASRIRDYLGLHPSAQLPVSFSYEVQSGDTASSIAERFGLQEATVLFNNFDIYDANHLVVGQLLNLPSVDGLIYDVQPGDTLDGLIKNFQASMEATLAYPANGITSPDQIFVEQRLLLVHGSASVASGSASSATGGQGAQVWTEPQFVLYLRYDKISDYFGTPRANAVGYHTGVDYIAPVGELIGAAASGVVSVATWGPSYGNWVEIDHGGGYRSRYAHLDVINVREGQWVEASNYIGTVGNTGNSSGAHLHFEIIVNGEAVNPLAWLN